MNKFFGQIPKPDPYDAASIAQAASELERSHYGGRNPDDEFGPDRFPPRKVDIPNADDSEEVVEDFDSASLPVSQGRDDEIHEGATGKVVEEGIEYLAFYKSFRDFLEAPARKRWGIFFIKKRCVALATDMIFSTGESFSDCQNALTAFLYTHELYHYRFDAHCLQMEATRGDPVYRPYRSRVAKRPISEWHEESIANFYGLNALRSKISDDYYIHYIPNYPQPIVDYLCDLVANSPGAYADGIKEEQQWSRKNQMAQQASAAFPNAGTSDLKSLVNSTIRLGMNLSNPRESTLSSFLRLNKCPVYWIDWVKDGKSVLVPQATSLEEINDFIIRYLAGVKDHHSDHSYYLIDNGEKVKLPNRHRYDLTNHEFANIIRKAGMTSPKFFSERNRTSVWRKNVPRSQKLPSLIPSKGGAR